MSCHSNARLPGGAATGLALALTLIGVAEAARAQVHCELVDGGPVDETRLVLDILEPAAGEVIETDDPCGVLVEVSGTFSVDAPPTLYDFHVAIDQSGSTGDDSGVDVDEDGVLGEREDSIFEAEIAAAQAFVAALDPDRSRASVLSFNRGYTLRHELSANLPSVDAALEAMKGERPRWGTPYVDAMEGIRQEVVLRADPATRRQRAIFLSDGRPDETLADIEAKAAELADHGVVIDTFALGFLDSFALRRMAEITGGTFTALDRPGDIVDLLPSFVPVAHELSALEASAGTEGTVESDEATGTFTATIRVGAGTSRVVIRLETDGAEPLVLECELELVVATPLAAVAGEDVEACGGEVVTLDGSRSTFGACDAPRWRWLDAAGAELCGWSSSPTCVVDACADAGEVALEVGCEGDECTARDVLLVTCLAVEPPVPELLGTCGDTASVTCGPVEPGLEAGWDVDPAVDADGDGDPANDRDVAGCEAELEWPAGGPVEAVAVLVDPVTGCTSKTALAIELPGADEVLDVSGTACPDQVVELECGGSLPDSGYSWDLDASVDSDGNGVEDDDADAAGCSITHAWSETGEVQVRAWHDDGDGCTLLVAEGAIAIADALPPGEVRGVRITKEDGALVATWAGLPGSDAYRVTRGSLDDVHADRSATHVADPDAGAGRCTFDASRRFEDFDDAIDGRDWYYLVTARSPCGGEGGPGAGWDGTSAAPRPARTPSPGCP